MWQMTHSVHFVIWINLLLCVWHFHIYNEESIVLIDITQQLQMFVAFQSMSHVKKKKKNLQNCQADRLSLFSHTHKNYFIGPFRSNFTPYNHNQSKIHQNICSSYWRLYLLSSFDEILAGRYKYTGLCHEEYTIYCVILAIFVCVRLSAISKKLEWLLQVQLFRELFCWTIWRIQFKLGFFHTFASKMCKIMVFRIQ